MTPPSRLALAAAARAVAAAPLAAGCSATQPAPSRATVAACYAFAVQALDRHMRVTTIPPACAGLGHEAINQAVSRAIRTVAGPHRKVVARRLARTEAGYLAYLVTVVPQRAQPSEVAAPSRPSGGSPLRLAALGAWVVTVAAAPGCSPAGSPAAGCGGASPGRLVCRGRSSSVTSRLPSPGL